MKKSKKRWRIREWNRLRKKWKNLKEKLTINKVWNRLKKEVILLIKDYIRVS